MVQIPEYLVLGAQWRRLKRIANNDLGVVAGGRSNKVPFPDIR